MPAGTCIWYLLPSVLTLTAVAFLLAPSSWPARRRQPHGRSLSAHGDDDETVQEIGRTTTTTGVVIMPRPQQQQPQQYSDLLVVQPPPFLNDLAVDECVHIYDDIRRRIVKVSHEPPIFYLPRFLHETDCRTIIAAVANKMTSAATKQGVVEHRTGSMVAWLGDQDNNDDDDDHRDDRNSVIETTTKRKEDDDDNNNNNNNDHRDDRSSVIETTTKREEDDDDDRTSHNATILAGYLQHLTAQLFLPHASSVDAERLQVVRYDPQGRYDLHHDGYDRTVTVLTYLNGVAGTWFPFVNNDNDRDENNNDDVFIPTMQLGNENMLDGRVPGRDGLCFVGREDDTIIVPPSPPPPPAKGGGGGEQERGDDYTTKGRVVRVDAGDAICFYNYQPLVEPPNDDDDDIQQRRQPGSATTANDAGDDDDDATTIIMAWKTLHCGLPAPTTKWIATNWLSAVVEEKAVVRPQEVD